MTGDEFLKLLLRHEHDLRAFIGSLVLDRHVRDDVYQEVALTLWDRKEDFDRTHSFGAWARGIAAKKMLKHRERDARFPLLLGADAIEAIAQAYDRTETEVFGAEALQECLDQIPAKSRDLLELRYAKNWKADAIAAQTAATVDAVYQALSRLRSRLEECIRQRLAVAQGRP